MDAARVLVVEDDLDIANVLRMDLEDDGEPGERGEDPVELAADQVDRDAALAGDPARARAAAADAESDGGAGR